MYVESIAIFFADQTGALQPDKQVFYFFNANNIVAKNNQGPTKIWMFLCIC